MPNNIFTSSVPFVLCEWDTEKESLVDTETVTIRNATIDGISYLNSTIRRMYITAQRDAVAGWSPGEADRFLKLAMQHLVLLSVGTREGNEILFSTDDGMLHYMWVFVKHRFPTIEAWEKCLRSNGAVYRELMSRFHEAMLNLALLTSEEAGEKMPENADTSYIDGMVARLVATGLSKEDAMALTLEEANAVIEKWGEMRYGKNEAPKEPVMQTGNPEEFKEYMRQALS